MYLISNDDRSFAAIVLSSFEVLAPTGAAAANVNGQTIHSFIKIPTGSFTELKGETLRNFQLQMEPIKFLIFDEYSMIGLRMLHKIKTRCYEGKGNSDETFCGIFVYFFGDLRILPPVKDISLYSEPTDQYRNRGKAAFS